MYELFSKTSKDMTLTYGIRYDTDYVAIGHTAGCLNDNRQKQHWFVNDALNHMR